MVGTFDYTNSLDLQAVENAILKQLYSSNTKENDNYAQTGYIQALAGSEYMPAVALNNFQTGLYYDKGLGITVGSKSKIMISDDICMLDDVRLNCTNTILIDNAIYKDSVVYDIVLPKKFVLDFRLSGKCSVQLGLYIIEISDYMRVIHNDVVLMEAKNAGCTDYRIVVDKNIWIFADRYLVLQVENIFELAGLRFYNINGQLSNLKIYTKSTLQIDDLRITDGQIYADEIDICAKNIYLRGDVSIDSAKIKNIHLSNSDNYTPSLQVGENTGIYGENDRIGLSIDGQNAGLFTSQGVYFYSPLELPSGTSLLPGLKFTSVGMYEDAGQLCFLVGNEKVAVIGKEISAIGFQAMHNSRYLDSNVAVGSRALYSNIDGVGNTAIGQQTLYLSNVNNNTAVGFQAGRNILGDNNTILGYQALYGRNTGSNVQFNTAVGSRALRNLISGVSNTAIGYNAVNSNTIGSYNTAVGEAALLNTNGNDSTAVGFQAGKGWISGSNIFIGFQAGLQQADGKNNVIIGWKAGTYESERKSSGENNTIVGSLACNSELNNKNCLYLGYNVQPSSSSAENEIILGCNTQTCKINASTLTELTGCLLLACGSNDDPAIRFNNSNVGIFTGLNSFNLLVNKVNKFCVTAAKTDIDGILNTNGTIFNIQDGKATHMIFGDLIKNYRFQTVNQTFTISGKSDILQISDGQTNILTDVNLGKNLLVDGKAIFTEITSKSIDTDKINSLDLTVQINNHDTLHIKENQMGIGKYPDKSAILELYGDKGFLPPRMTTGDKLKLIPVRGLIVYDTMINQLQIYNGEKWISLHTDNGTWMQKSYFNRLDKNQMISIGQPISFEVKNGVSIITGGTILHNLGKLPIGTYKIELYLHTGTDLNLVDLSIGIWDTLDYENLQNLGSIECCAEHDLPIKVSYVFCIKESKNIVLKLYGELVRYSRVELLELKTNHVPSGRQLLIYKANKSSWFSNRGKFNIYFGYLFIQTDELHDYAEYDFANLTPGTYTVKFSLAYGNNNGIISIQLGEKPKGEFFGSNIQNIDTIDMYAEDNYLEDFEYTFEMHQYARKVIRFIISDKNISSIGYSMQIAKLALYKST